MKSIREIAEQNPGSKNLKKKDQKEMIDWAESLVQQSRNQIVFKRFLWIAVAVIILAFLVG